MLLKALSPHIFGTTIIGRAPFAPPSQAAASLPLRILPWQHCIEATSLCIIIQQDPLTTYVTLLSATIIATAKHNTQIILLTTPKGQGELLPHPDNTNSAVASSPEI
jgi:hypothetical protein